MEEEKYNNLQEREGLDPQDSLELAETANKVKKIINTMPEPQRTILQLRDIDGYEYNEIAEILEISVNTIRVNLSRARKKVRELLLKNYNYGSETNRDIITEIL